MTYKASRGRRPSDLRGALPSVTMAHLVQSVGVRHFEDDNTNAVSCLNRNLLSVPRGLAVFVDAGTSGWRKRKRGPIEAVVAPKRPTPNQQHSFMGCSMSPLMQYTSNQALTVAGMCEVCFLGDESLQTKSLGAPVYVSNSDNSHKHRGRFTTKAPTDSAETPVGFFVHPTSDKSGMIYVQLAESQRAKRLLADNTILFDKRADKAIEEKVWSVKPLAKRRKNLTPTVVAGDGAGVTATLPSLSVEVETNDDGSRDGAESEASGDSDTENDGTAAPASEVSATINAAGDQAGNQAEMGANMGIPDVRILFKQLVTKPAATLEEHVAPIVDPELAEVATALAKVCRSPADDAGLAAVLLFNAIQTAFTSRIISKFPSVGVDFAAMCASVIAAKGETKFGKKLRTLRARAAKEIKQDEDVDACMNELRDVLKVVEGSIPADADKREEMCRVVAAVAQRMGSLTECREGQGYIPAELVTWAVAQMMSAKNTQAFRSKSEQVQRCLAAKYLHDRLEHLPDECKLAPHASSTSALRT